MMGGHLIKHWSSTQKTLSLSSGESELSGILKGTSEAFGLRSLAEDLGITVDVKVRTDASAAVGICRRCGVGKVRHLAVGKLWVQEKLRAGEFELYKHPGAHNPGDILTKHVPTALIERHAEAMGLGFMEGRPDKAPRATEEQGKARRP